METVNEVSMWREAKEVEIQAVKDKFDPLLYPTIKMTDEGRPCFYQPDVDALVAEVKRLRELVAKLASADLPPEGEEPHD